MENYGGLGKPMDYVASAFIFHDSRILLVFHKKLKIWLPPGGHIEKDSNSRFAETPDEAVIREVKEETGLDVEITGKKFNRGRGEIKFLHIPVFMHVHKIDEAHDHLGFDYICKIKGSKTEGKGDSEWKWFGLEEIDGLKTRDELKNRIKFLMRKINYER